MTAAARCACSSLDDLVVPITAVIIVALFAFQLMGTGSVGRLFATAFRAGGDRAQRRCTPTWVISGGRRSQAWLVLVFPACILSYLGQGALILRDPRPTSAARSSLPAWARLLSESGRKHREIQSPRPGLSGKCASVAVPTGAWWRRVLPSWVRAGRCGVRAR